MVLFTLKVGNRAYTRAAPVKLQQNAAVQDPPWKLMWESKPQKT